MNRPLAPRDIVRSDLCVGCGACVGISQPDQAGMSWDAHGQLKPRSRADAAWDRHASDTFARTCPFSPQAANEDVIAEARFPAARQAHPLLGRFEQAYVGYAAEGEFRPWGSSGGMVSWTAAELLRRGLVDGVAHVAPRDPAGGEGYFGYRISRSLEEVRGGAKSRYHPIHMADVVREIRAVPGRYAIVGVPCFIKAVQLLRREDPVLRDRIAFTLGLFCGHMKSRRLVDSFAWQLGAPVEAVEAVEYRLKDESRPANWYTAHLSLRDGRRLWRDWWHLADGDWGAGFFQNPACDMCDDVVAETADIAFGDAWVEPYSSDGRGTNVVLVRSPRVAELIEQARAEGRLALDRVDADFIVQTQAAGFRHRREGLAYRLTWRRRGILPRKRVAPNAHGLPLRRRLVYRLRAWIARWSHRAGSAAARLGLPGLYVRWARTSLYLYRALTYSAGRLGGWIDALEKRLTTGNPPRLLPGRGTAEGGGGAVLLPRHPMKKPLHRTSCGPPPRENRGEDLVGAREGRPDQPSIKSR
jgi:coenzyme F420-reducing hydrogenase beta subunit